MNRDRQSQKADPAGEKKTEKKKMIPVKEADFQKLQQEASEYKERYVRLLAEFENARKRNERERHEFIKFANEGLITEFLGILDDLERSVQAAYDKHEDYTAFLKGVEMVMARIFELLKKSNVKPIESIGRKFDPHFHEILMQTETDEVADQTVTEEFQKGYLLGDRVVRTSKVKVAVTPRGEDANPKPSRGEQEEKR